MATSHPRILAPPKGSFFLLGPRGTGKSTWLRSHFPKAHWVDLLNEERYQNFLRTPALFAVELQPLPIGSTVVVDEIQRLPGLLNEVHRFIEERQLRFCLCGSSARKLNRAGVNLLGGRAVRRAMHPFVPEELGDSFKMEEALRWGLLPVVRSAPDADEALEGYARLYLKEEIQSEGLARNLAGFSRFLPVVALGHGQLLNASNLARDAGVARTTVVGYLDILEQTLLGFTLPAYSPKLRVRERHHPKWYWCDPGLVRAMKKSRGDLHPEERGPLFEGLVAQILRAYGDYTNAFDCLYYWASSNSGRREVDFIITRGTATIAIEVKAGVLFQDSWCGGLRALEPLPDLQRRLIVYPGLQTLATRDGIEILPFNRFLEQLQKGFWEN